MKKNSCLIIILIVILSSCKTSLVYIKVTNPAPVTISNNSKNVGIANRAIPSEDNKTLNTIHQATSGESLKLIKEASAESVRGLNDALTQNKRFDIVKPLNQVELRTPVIGSFPSQLSWTEVESICKKNNVDLLFVLEVFDTELKIVPLTPPPPPTKITNVVDVINTVTQAQVNITTIIKTGWRIYDPKNKYILDEFPLTDYLTITANAATVVNTTEAMMGRKEAIKQSANKLGNRYADRLIPYYITVTREYYVKGSENFKIATRKARTGNWDSAGELWLKEANSSKRKMAGRGSYNMAILNEINGDLDAAIQWAQKSYENYNNKLALKYVNILKYRKQSNQRLQNQFEN